MTGRVVALDNRPVRSVRRVRSKVFATVLPANDVFGAVGACAVAGRPCSPSVDDGHCVRLSGLREGTHTPSIQGAPSGRSVNVFYTLDVVKVLPKERDPVRPRPTAEQGFSSTRTPTDLPALKAV